MTVPGILEIVLFLIIIFLLAKPVGLYMTRVFAGERTWLTPMLLPLETAIYRISGVDPEQEQSWVGYTLGMLLFSAAGLLLTYAIERTQSVLPFNPNSIGPVEAALAFNTAASFTTNTNWQNYGGEGTMSYFTQMAGLAVHNFTSATVGIAIAVALIRGLTRRSASEIGNFWVDIVRGTLYLLLPISIVGALVFVWQGMPQTLGPNVVATTLEGGKQTITLGPVASQEIIKELGTNGGGFFNANSAHPFENPTPFTNFLEVVAIFAIPSGLTYSFGRMTGNTRNGWAIWAAMAILFAVGVAVALPAEQAGNPLLTKLGVDQTASALQPGGNFEGKETRFGMASSILFTVVTTDASCGAVNNMHDSLMPLAGLVPLFNIQTGEVIFGGVGAGLYGMLIFAILAVFIAGLMVGRTPEYLGKKIQSYEMKMAMLAVLVLAADILVFAAIASVIPAGTSSTNNPGAHGFSEILYAYSSMTGNNGSAFAGLNGNTAFYNVTGAFAMLIGRFLMIVPILAIAGSMARKVRVPPSLGTFPTDGGLFVGLLVGTVLIVGALTYFPALALGPIVDHIQLWAGHTF
ncbi:MAG TPA: potassium-transporting ATPase subunit KdpA [Chloroflexota bacterium]|nr:potassium-transporting ATPase subunit KdpA [Chloroflexota bacterium]